MAVANGLYQIFAVDRGDVLPRVLAETPLLRFAVLLGQVGDLIGFAFQNAVFFAEIEKAATELAGDDADVFGTELGPGAIARGLLDGLLEFGLGDRVFLALDDGKGAFPLGILENHQIGAIIRNPIRDGQFDTDGFGLVAVAIDQLCPIFGPDLFFGIGIPLTVIDGVIVNPLFLPLAGYGRQIVLYGLFEVGCYFLLHDKALIVLGRG